MANENTKKAQYDEQTEPQLLPLDQQENFYYPILPSPKMWHMDLPKDYHLHFQFESPGEYVYEQVTHHEWISFYPGGDEILVVY